MDIPDYPSNKQPEQDPKNIKRITSTEPRRKKKSLGKQFKETFVVGDAKTAVNYVVFDVMIPAAKDMIEDGVQQWLHQLMFGRATRKGSSTPPQTGPTGYVGYNRYAMTGNRQTSSQRALSRQARARHDFDEMIFTARGEAEDVHAQLYEIVDRYGEASVADLYTLVGINSTYTDQKWGWRSLRGGGVTRVRDGYLLDLPEPQPLD